TKVNPTDEEQKTGLTVKNQDETTPTTVTAKDEDGTEIPVTIDSKTGEIKVTPGTNVDGPITVTIKDEDFKTDENPEGIITKEVPVTGHTKGVDDNGSDKTQADTTNPLIPEKTPVVNKEDLTEEEKAEVKKKIEDANKDVFPQAKEGQEATKVEIGKDGAATITYPDKSQDTIKGEDLVREKTKLTGTPVVVNPSDEEQATGVKVENQDKETPITEITAKDEDNNELAVLIDENGNILVTPTEKVDGPITVTVKDADFEGGSQTFEVPVKGHSKGVDDNGSDKTQADTTNPLIPEKTPVVNKEDLTEEEKAEVKKKIEDANKDVFPQAKEGQEATKVEIGKDGTATITYPDKSQDTIKGEDLVVEKAKPVQTEAEKNPAVAPEKTTVENKEKLTPEEKQEVEAKV
ncbi:hypothetical protein HV819_11400, partial [Anaerococcus sp. AGMB00486]